MTDMEKRSIPELLAPVGSMDALKAAVNAGADAVYLSGKNFGARYYADNFNQDQMVKALDYAHLKNVKVYVTVNTLIRDEELGEISKYLIWLYRIGVDALILQDIGVASICRELIPDMVLHASTQMTINSAEGVKWAYESGFKRVILSRELNLSEVEEILQEIDGKVELEIFAHGALCYSYSGQCLLSSVIGGRSGNRGRCAQPCRKPYQLLQGNIDKYGKLTSTNPINTIENYLLSTKDLALYSQLERITRTPITSLKIEGRMRSPEYVAIVVSTYRKALNDLSHNNWDINEGEISRLKLAFNRGFTSGYLLENNCELVMGREAPGNRGVYLGNVGKRNKSKFVIELDSILPDFMLEKGDGIVILHPESDFKYGMAIDISPEYLNPHKLLLKTKKQVPPGSKVYLTRDNSLTRQAKKLIRDESRAAIPLNINMELDENNTPILKGKFIHNGKSLDINLKADFSLKPAKKSPLSKKQIIDQLKKTGGTPFIVKDIEVDYPGNLFTSLSKLNKLRREFIKRAQIKLLNSHRPTDNSIKTARKHLLKIKHEFKLSSPNILGQFEQSTQSNSMEIAVYTSSLETIKGALKGNSKRIYFEPFIWEHFKRQNPCEVINWTSKKNQLQELLMEAQELCTAGGATLIWKWPSITGNASLKNLKKLINPLYNAGLSEVMVGNMGAFRAINLLDIPISICGSAELNIWNHRSFNELSNGFNRLTLSNELSKEDLSNLLLHMTNSGLGFDLIVQGNLDSLISEDCLLKAADNHKLKPRDIKNHYHRSNQNVIENHWHLKDDRNRIFPVIIDDESHTHILNSVELCLIDYIPYFYQMGFHELIIDTRAKTSLYANAMVRYYNQGLDFKENTDINIHKLNILKNKVKKISRGGITTGNFLKSPG